MINKNSCQFKIFPSSSQSVIQQKLNQGELFNFTIGKTQENYFVLKTHKMLSLNTLCSILINKQVQFQKIEIYVEGENNQKQESLEDQFQKILVQIGRDHTFYDQIISHQFPIDDYLWFYIIQKQQHSRMQDTKQQSFELFLEKQEILKKQQNLLKFQANQQEKQLPDLGFSFIQNNSSAQDSSTQNNSFQKIMLENSGNTSTDQVGEEQKNQASLQNTQKDQKNQTRHEISIDNHIKQIRKSRSKSFDHKQRPQTPLKKAPTPNKNILQQQSEQNE